MATLNQIFTSHMVLQANQPIRVFGIGCGNISVYIDGRTGAVRSADSDWLIELEPHDYGGPYTMTIIIDGQETVLEDVHFGDVYLLGGQSNMQMKLLETNEPKECYVDSDDVRLFSVDRPEEGECIFSKDGWVLCGKELAGEFPAIGYFVGTRMAEMTGRKIGLISCCQGASVIQTWMPKALFDNDRFYISDADKFCDHFDFPWNGYGHLYETMLSKVIPFSIKAALWYQGEANSSVAEAAIYLDLLEAFITNTRNVFRHNMPFIVVYLPWDGPGWRGIQEAQMRAQDMIPCVYTVVSHDVCENNNLHPKNKKDLSLRITEILLKI